MAEVQALRGVRYDLGHVGALSDVIAPPYDVIDADLQQALYKRHPSNVIRLILNRDEPGDQNSGEKYARAGRFFRNWLAEGVLFKEADPALYVYHQQFNYLGRTFVRRGFVGRVRLEKFGEGKIYPHEHTHAGPKQDRLLLTQACRANLSPIFGIYPDAGNAVQSRLEQSISEKTPLEAVDHLGVIHRLWPVTDVATIGAVSTAMDPVPIYVADGHHRYETACNYRDGLASGGTLPADHPANFVLMTFVSMYDPGLIIMPTHRLFSGVPKWTSAELRQKLEPFFHTSLVGSGQQSTQDVWEELQLDDDPGALALYTAADEQWTVAALTQVGRTKMAEIAAEHSAAWRGLGVAILHRLVMDTLLGQAGHPKPEYVHLAEEVADRLTTGQFQLASLVQPATIEEICQISEHKERMPQKSTYFYPKLLSGLVFNPLE